MRAHAAVRHTFTSRAACSNFCLTGKVMERRKGGEERSVKYRAPLEAWGASLDDGTYLEGEVSGYAPKEEADHRNAVHLHFPPFLLAALEDVAQRDAHVRGRAREVCRAHGVA